MKTGKQIRKVSVELGTDLIENVSLIDFLNMWQ